MKKILFFLFTLIPITIFSQDFNGNNYLPEEDNLSAQVSFLPLNNSGAMVYDSVRALTEINQTGQSDAFPWISADGLRLYYTHDNGTQNIKYAERTTTSGYFNSPVVVNVSTSPGKRSIWLSANELEAYFSTGNSLYYLQRASVSSAWNTPALVSVGGGPYSFAFSASLTPAMDEMYLYVQPTGGTSVVRQFSKVSSTSFTYVQDLAIPATYEYGAGQLSKDGLTYYLSSVSGTGNHQLYKLTRSNVASAFLASTFQIVPDVNDNSVFNAQPSVSGNENIMVFTRNATNQWLENQLYIASQSGISSVFEPSLSNNISVYPNPSKEIFNISLDKQRNTTIEIYNIYGEIVYKSRHNSDKISIDLTGASVSIYFLKVFENDALIGTSKLIKQ